MISTETAQFLLWLVNQQQPNAGAPDFREAVQSIMRAQDELQAVIDAAGQGTEVQDKSRNREPVSR